jgi:hypothetical protein
MLFPYHHGQTFWAKFAYFGREKYYIIISLLDDFFPKFLACRQRKLNLQATRLPRPHLHQARRVAQKGRRPRRIAEDSRNLRGTAARHATLGEGRSRSLQETSTDIGGPMAVWGYST